MEYVAMLNDPSLVKGLEELLIDPEHSVVKRTIRVFANVYRHALDLLATGEVEYDIYKAAWPAVNSVSDSLIEMLTSAENEGVLVHLVRFLEAALVAHLLSDISRYPDLIEDVTPVFNKGLDALRNLVTTPYVGGTVFIVGIKSLITVACYKNDIRTEVITLLQKLIKSPPPTLFDHNVRSFHKILQRNLFRLLRRSDSSDEKEVLVDMMVSVGVPRKMLHQWSTPIESRKRHTTTNLEDQIKFPPSKRSKNSPPSSGRITPPDHDKKKPKSVAPNQNSQTVPKDGKNNENSSQSLFKELQAATEKLEKEQQEKARNNSDKNHEGKTLLTSKPEHILYNALPHSNVVSLVLANLDRVPDSPPVNLLQLFKQNNISDNDTINVVRQRIAKMFSQKLTLAQINAIGSSVNSSPTSSRSNSPLERQSTPPLPDSSRSGSPLQQPVKNVDTDLRQLLGRRDIDMRMMVNTRRDDHSSGSSSPQDSSRSPTLSPSLECQSRPLNSDPRLANQSKSNLTDPRLNQGGDNSRISNDPRLVSARHDPRLSSRTDPRLSSKRPDPRVSSHNSEHRKDSLNLDPRISSGNSDSTLGLSSTNSIINSVNTDPRISSQNIDPRRGLQNSDPRINPQISGTRLAQKSLDPRINSQNVDPRMGAVPRSNVQQLDPRLSQHNLDNRLPSQNIDPRLGPMNSDPRIGSQNPNMMNLINTNQRLGALNQDLRLQANIDPRISSLNTDQALPMLGQDPRMFNPLQDGRNIPFSQLQPLKDIPINPQLLANSSQEVISSIPFNSLLNPPFQIPNSMNNINNLCHNMGPRGPMVDGPRPNGAPWVNSGTPMMVLPNNNNTKQHPFGSLM